jgi:hypothetical protein
VIEFNRNIGELVLTLFVTLGFFGLGLFLVIYPHKAVGLLARWLRVYQRIFGLSDNDLDKTGFPIQRSQYRKTRYGLDLTCRGLMAHCA